MQIHTISLHHKMVFSHEIKLEKNIFLGVLFYILCYLIKADSIIMCDTIVFVDDCAVFIHVYLPLFM